MRGKCCVCGRIGTQLTAFLRPSGARRLEKNHKNLMLIRLAADSLGQHLVFCTPSIKIQRVFNAPLPEGVSLMFPPLLGGHLGNQCFLPIPDSFPRCGMV
jgi:hypothetical protein